MKDKRALTPRQRVAAARKAIEDGDLVAAHRIVYGFDAEDERVLRELDARRGRSDNNGYEG